MCCQSGHLPIGASSGRLSYLLLSVIVALIGCFGALLYLVIESESAADSSLLAAGLHQDEHTREAGLLIKRLAPILRHADKPTSITVSQQELQALAHLGHNIYPRLRTHAAITDSQTQFIVSLNIDGHDRWFINSRVNIAEAERGIQFADVRVGKLHIHPKLAQLLLVPVSRWIVGSDNAQTLLNSIGKVEFSQQQAVFDFIPTQQFNEHMSGAINTLHSHSTENVDINPARVQFYLDYLQRHQYHAPRGHQSLAVLMRPLFALSQQQSQEHALSAAAENEAMLLALAVLMGPGIFRHFVPDLDTEALKTHPRPGLTLRGRGDLAKHFIYSAAIEILSNAGASFSIGQAKELVDSDRNGSGFSFVDLAADKAGIEFAILATGNDQDAQKVQTILAADSDEDHFFPATNGLPEGLSQARFESDYGSTTATPYLLMVEAIDQRIRAASIYR